MKEYEKAMKCYKEKMKVYKEETRKYELWIVESEAQYLEKRLTKAKIAIDKVKRKHIREVKKDG
jgi:hypothetical protein